MPWIFLGHLLRDHLHRYAEAETAYQTAIQLNPKDSHAWNGLGNLYCDFLNQLQNADIAYQRALTVQKEELALSNMVFLQRDFVGKGLEAKPIYLELDSLAEHEYPDSVLLHEALFAAYEQNWGLSCVALSKALALRLGGFADGNTDDWLRASAVLLHLNYGAELVTFLDQLGDTAARLRPWVEALRALQIGDRRALQNIAPEIRITAEVFYDGIEKRLLKLPEQTRRRPLPKANGTRPKKAKRQS